jgi:hypothetical protein
VTRRWLIVLVTAAALVVIPLAVAARPAAGSNISAVDLAQRVQASREVSWSGLVESTGALKVPDSDSFANLSQLLGENNELRVWWRSPEQWRVDRIRSTGETDLFRNGQTSIRWVFESEQATIAPVSVIRLPDASDVLPPTLGRELLQGFQPDEVTRLPARRVAGLDAPGLRLSPHEDAGTVDHVDLWVDPASGLPLQIELYGAGDSRPVLTTAFVELDRAIPALKITTFVRAQGTKVEYENSVDVAAAANALAPFDLPATLGGLPARRGVDPGAVGAYGRGPTTLFALPLRGQVAGPLRQRLRDSPAVQETAVGTLLPVGPIGLLVTPRRQGGSFLLAGTVTSETLQRAAAELLAST